MLVNVFEVCLEGEDDWIMFLTEKEAREQTILSPSENPIKTIVEMTEDEYNELVEKRFAWIY